MNGELARCVETNLDRAIADIPESWRFLEVNFPAETKKTRINFYLDEDVHQFFKRGGGINWQERIRAILRAYVSLRTKNHLANSAPPPVELVEDLLLGGEENFYWQFYQREKILEKLQRLELEHAINKIAQAVGEYATLCKQIANNADHQAYFAEALKQDTTRNSENTPADQQTVERARAALFERLNANMENNSPRDLDDDPFRR